MNTFIRYIIIAIALLSSVYGQGQEIRVATYNIRLLNRSDSLQGNGWWHRRDALCGLVGFHDFDIFGAQEVCWPQLRYILEKLPQYDYVGVGRDDGKTAGEFSPVFYKRDRFELLDGGTFWLAERTDTPSKGWDAACMRICSWGRFEDRASGRRFWFFNLHMDHRGVEARRQSARLVLSRIERMCGGEPVILTGDFNVDQTNESYRLLDDSPILDDAYKVAGVRYALNGTFNAFDPNRKTDSRIDHIFVGGGIVVERYGILTDTYRSQAQEEVALRDFPREVTMRKAVARTPSDHFPVCAVLDLGARE